MVMDISAPRRPCPLMNNRMQALVNALTDGLIVIGAGSIIESVNAAAAQMFNYLQADVIGHDVRTLLPDLDLSAPGLLGHSNVLQAQLPANVGKGPGEGSERLGRRRDGSLFPIEIAVNEACVDGDSLFVATVRDAAQRHDADLLAAAASARTLAIMNTVLDGLITIDQNGTIETFNPAAARIFGYLPADVIGRNIKMLMPEPYHSAHDGYLTNYLQTGDAKVIGAGREVLGRRKDGSVFPMDLGVSEMSVTGKRMFVGTIRDITDRKKSETAMRETIAALSRSNQELDEFAYIASHDPREPLRGLSNNALYLQRISATSSVSPAAAASLGLPICASAWNI